MRPTTGATIQHFCHLMQVEDKLSQTIRVGGELAHWDIGWPVNGAEIRQHPLHKRMSGLFARSRCAGSEVLEGAGE